MNVHTNEGSLPRFTCQCNTFIEVTETWRQQNNNAFWIEQFCSLKCAEKYLSTHLFKRIMHLEMAVRKLEDCLLERDFELSELKLSLEKTNDLKG